MYNYRYKNQSFNTQNNRKHEINKIIRKNKTIINRIQLFIINNNNNNNNNINTHKVSKSKELVSYIHHNTFHTSLNTFLHLSKFYVTTNQSKTIHKYMVKYVRKDRAKTKTKRRLSRARSSSGGTFPRNPRPITYCFVPCRRR